MAATPSPGMRVARGPHALEVGHARGPVLRYDADPRYRPHVHPLYAPGTDSPLTRRLPADHPWQVGAYVGLNDVNGQDFWCCGHAYYPPETRGSVRSASLSAEERGGGVELAAEHDWLDAAGRPLARERQVWHVHPPAADGHAIDVRFELHALAEPLRIGRYDYGGLAVRLVGDLATRRVLDSEGRRDAPDANWERARWVAMAQPVDGVGAYVRGAPDLLAYAYAGVAILDHPGNGPAPALWRVDGSLLNPSPQRDGPLEAAAGESVGFAYRLVVFLGDCDGERIEEEYRRWAG
ncbi:MAG TPA: PmoA family protein [Gaiellaceae bacterium]|nr:PmoA family protein [Gaiellaceae bacterium]